MPEMKSSPGKKNVIGSHIKALHKNLIAPHLYRFMRDRVPKTNYPVLWCTLEDGMGKT
jgi:hypothetical protein